MVLDEKNVGDNSSRPSFIKRYWYVLLIAFFLSLATGLSYYYVAGLPTSLGDDANLDRGRAEAWRPERLNFLVLGNDAALEGASREATRSDVVMVASLDIANKQAGVLSIPRDSLVPIPGHGKDKIAHAHVYGGPQLVRQTLEEFLGVSIPYYVRIDFEGFVKIIDILGGIDFNVPQRMYYVDSSQGLKIDLQPGPQHLSGAQVLQLVRFRQYPQGDIQRVEVQQALLKQIVNEMLSVNSLIKLPSLVTQVLPHVKTNLGLTDALRLAKAASEIDPNKVKFGVLSGRGTWAAQRDGSQVSYWVVDELEKEKMVAQLLRGVDPDEDVQVKVSVLNGSGKPGAARSLAQALKDRGFIVVKVDNALRADYPFTMVVSHPEKKGKLEKVITSLEEVKVPVRLGSESLLREESISDTEADVTVVIGGDFPIGFPNTGSNRS